MLHAFFSFEHFQYNHSINGNKTQTEAIGNEAHLLTQSYPIQTLFNIFL